MTSEQIISCHGPQLMSCMICREILGPNVHGYHECASQKLPENVTGIVALLQVLAHDKTTLCPIKDLQRENSALFTT